MPNVPYLMSRYRWDKPDSIATANYACGYCSHRVASDRGWKLFSESDGRQSGGAYVCPECRCPTFIFPEGSGQYPDVAYGSPVPNVPNELHRLYEEARSCTASGCYTSAVLTLRKMLMNIAAAKGADEGLQFIAYVNFLETNHYTPPNSREWVDHIRKKGNEATHEIALMTADDARELVTFVEMLLRFNFEFPSKFKAPAAAPGT